MHNITDTDHLFTVREPAWHGLGTVLDDYPSDWAEARKAAGLDWDPVETDVFVEQRIDNDNSAVVPVEGHKAIVRDDTGELLSIVNGTYSVFDNSELGPLVEALLDEDDVRYETAGSLKGGRKVWVLVRLAEPFEIPGDPHGATLPRLAIQNSHDGSTSLRAQRLQTRIVCDNTSHAADREAGRHGYDYQFRHTKNMHEYIDRAKEALAGLRSDRDEYRKWAQLLLDITVTNEQREMFVRQFHPDPPSAVAVSDRVMSNIKTARQQVRNVLDSPTCADTAHTAYGLVQAGVEYLDHLRGARNAETHFTRTYLNAEPAKRKVEKLAREVANA